MSEWYYMYGGQQQGPVRGSQLKALAASGSLGPDDLVWNQSLPEWTPAKRVRGLTFPAVAAVGQAPAVTHAAPAPAPVQEYSQPQEYAQETHAQPQAGAAPEYAQPAAEYAQPFQAAPAPCAPEGYAQPADQAQSTGDGVSPVTLQMLQQSRTWMLIVTIFLFVVAGLLLVVAGIGVIGAMSIMALANSHGNARIPAPAMGMVIVVAIIEALEGVAIFFLGLFLAKYLGAIKRVTTTKRVADLDTAMKAQKTFWTVAGILSLVAAGLMLVLVVLSIVMRVTD